MRRQLGSHVGAMISGERAIERETNTRGNGLKMNTDLAIALSHNMKANSIT